MLILYWLLVALMVVGIIGAVVPGNSRNHFDFDCHWGYCLSSLMSVPLVVTIGVLALSVGIDFLASYWERNALGLYLAD